MKEKDMKRKRGILIAFEGPEGCGKSTQAKLFYERLKEYGVPALLTKEPDGPIREVLQSKNDFDPLAESLLFVAWRTENFLKKIIPAIKKGKVAVTDRCSGSTVAYQFYGREMSQAAQNFVMRVDAMARRNYDIDMNILIDCPVEIGLKRIEKSRKKLTFFEKRGSEFHQRVRQGYLRQAKDDPERWKVFDGEKSIEELREAIWEFLNEKFNLVGGKNL